MSHSHFTLKHTEAGHTLTPPPTADHPADEGCAAMREGGQLGKPLSYFVYLTFIPCFLYSILTPSWKITLVITCNPVSFKSRNHRELLQLTSWQNFLAWLRAGTSRTLGQSDPLCENFEFLVAMPCKGRKEKEHSKDGISKECPSELPSGDPL